MAWIYAIQVIPVPSNLYLIANYFSKYMVKKIGCIMPEIFDVFTFFSCNPFSTWNRITKLCRTPSPPPVTLHNFCCRARVPLSWSVKHFWKCWIISEIRNTYCFPLYLEKVKNWAKLLESKRWSLTVMLPNSDPFEIFDYLLPPARFDVERFLNSIRTSKMRIFVNFYIDQHFQGHLLQELDDQTQYDHFCENLMKIGSMMSHIFKVFIFFQITNLEVTALFYR